MLSYRPISNLTTISKVIERLVLDRLGPHLLSSPNFARLQSAYRRGHSTETVNTVYTQPPICQDHRTGWARHLGVLRHHRPRCVCQPLRVTVRCCRRCLQLATVLSPRTSAVRASWRTLVSVRLWRTAGFSARPAAVHYYYWNYHKPLMCYSAGLHEAQPSHARIVFTQWSKNGFFAPQGRHVYVCDTYTYAEFHVYYRGKTVGIQPPKLSKFRILAINLPLRGDSFGQFLRNSQHLYASKGSFTIFSLVAFGRQTTKL